MEINQLDGKPIFLEETFFLGDVRLTEFSRDEAGDAKPRELRSVYSAGAE